MDIEVLNPKFIAVGGSFFGGKMEYGQLLKKLLPKIKGIAFKLNRYYGPFAYDDLCQEAITHLWVNFKEGHLADKTQSYILHGCYFHLRNYIRKFSEKNIFLSLDSLVNEDNDVTLEGLLVLSDGRDLRDALNNKFLVDAIENNGFTTREKQILRFYKDGLTTREIGGRLSLSHVRIVKIMQNIRIKCRKYQDII